MTRKISIKESADPGISPASLSTYLVADAQDR